MSGFFILCAAVPAVADDAADLSVDILHEVGVLQEDLFPHLQRRHFTPSAFAGGFLRLFLWLFGYLGYLFQKLYIAMAIYTGAYCRFTRGGGCYLFTAENGNENYNCEEKYYCTRDSKPSHAFLISHICIR
jgi:hypothetical protein